MTDTPLQALGICLEEYEYPYPVRFLPVSNDLQSLTMAYMDIPPSGEPNGRTVVLMHGKAFGCYYFQNVIEALTGAGYRVVAPPVLLVVGAEDHTVPLGNYATPAEDARLGDFVALSAAAAADIPHATRVVVPDCGHISHLEAPSTFLGQLLPFLAN
jgi:pimeloyl-ACP methyl ester carboxylesterase